MIQNQKTQFQSTNIRPAYTRQAIPNRKSPRFGEIELLPETLVAGPAFYIRVTWRVAADGMIVGYYDAHFTAHVKPIVRWQTRFFALSHSYIILFQQWLRIPAVVLCRPPADASSGRSGSNARAKAARLELERDGRSAAGA